MKIWFGLVVLTGSAFLTSAAEETSLQRLENAQRGVAEPSWPKKPEHRLSPLSGKMKSVSEITPRAYGQNKEFHSREAAAWQKSARMDSGDRWVTAAGRGWDQARWNSSADWSEGEKKHQKFQPGKDPSPVRSLTFRDLGRESAPGWSSRSSSLGGGTDGSLRMYEGRLIRVRQQVWREDENPRDLGPDRQEKFSPEEVERMLSQPVARGREMVKEQSPEASPLAVADN